MKPGFKASPVMPRPYLRTRKYHDNDKNYVQPYSFPQHDYSSPYRGYRLPETADDPINDYSTITR